MKKQLFPVLITALLLLFTEYGFGITLTFSVSPSSCGAADGHIHVSANGGDAPYTFQWSNGDTKSHIENLLPGTYVVTVTDQSGTTAIDSAVVGSNNYLHIMADDHSATGIDSNGYLEIHIDGGQSPFTIASGCPGWTPADTQSLLHDFNVTGLYGYSPAFIPGMGCAPKYSGIEYELDITDNSGCHGHIKKTIHAIGFYGSPSTSSSCGNISSGKIHDTLSFTNGSFSFHSTDIKIIISNLSNVPVDSLIIHHSGPGPGQNTIAYEFDSIAAGDYIINCFLEDVNAPGNPFFTTAYTTDTVNVFNLGLSCGNVSGIVFFDANGNCLQELNEPGLKNSVVEIQPGNHFTLTDSNGAYAYSLPLGNFNIQHSPSFNAALITVCPSVQPVPFSMTTPQQQLIMNFADSSAGKDLSSKVFITALQPGHSANIIATAINISATTSYNDTLIVRFDTLLTITGTDSPAFSQGTGIVKFSIDSLPPFTARTFTIHTLLENDSALTDTILWASTELISLNDYNPQNNSDSTSRTVKALVSPHHISVYPGGFGLANYVPLSQEPLKYLVEFQNTGSDTAFTITMKQEISEALDLTSFCQIASSHPYSFIFNEREILFTFNNINLPDSVTNDSASRGYIAFHLIQSPTAKAADQIDAVMNMSFDIQSPVSTDTCRLTLYDCDSLFASLPLSILACENSTISFGVTTSIACPLQWWYDGLAYTTTPSITIPNIIAGQHVVIAEAITPYCSNTQLYAVNVATLPEAIISVSGDTLTADPTGVSYQWFFENVAIPGATDPTYVATASGNYTVQVTSFIGCVNTSNPIYVSITSLGELAANGIAVFPNPGNNELNLILPATIAENSEIYLVATDGRIVRRISTDNQQIFLINTSELSSGIYQLVLINNSEKYSVRWVKQ